MSDVAPIVGVLGLQGDYQKHQEMLASINVPSLAVRHAEDFERIDRLIIPGGESTVIADLLVRLGMAERFSAFIRTRPVWGTCAGMILLAAEVNDHSVNPYGMIDISVDRNGYGRQVFSTIIATTFSLNGHSETLEMVFIRSPRVTRIGTGVTVLARRGDDPVLLRQRNVLVSAFHPELTASAVLHNYFARRFVIA